MLLIKHLGILANAVYSTSETTDFPRLHQRDASGSDGFQAAAFAAGSQVAVAFRGTSQKADVAADLALGVGMNSAYFAQGEDFVDEVRAKVGDDKEIVLCGHSLGGAIAQVVANRKKLPMVTFNAPGVGVLSSREVLTSNPTMMKVRLAGMVASAVISPGQALRDIKSAFNVVKGLNICLLFDPVSQIGLHYGEVTRLFTRPMDPLTAHRMTTVNEVLQDHIIAGRAASF